MKFLSFGQWKTEKATKEKVEFDSAAPTKTGTVSRAAVESTTDKITELSGADIDATFSGTSLDLVSAALGGSIHSFSDEYFAAASNLLTPGEPIRKKGYYVSTGAWFDGWETRRHNQEEYDWVIIRLGVSAGTVNGVEIDTAHFNGNQAPEASVEGIFLPDGQEAQLADGGKYLPWVEILPKKECKPSHRHAWLLPKPTTEKFNYVRLRQYPDGGIARFRLYGSVVSVFPLTASSEPFNLAAATLGALTTSCSDQHFGVKSNLILPGRGKDMGDGWETARSRGGDHQDWVVFRLACPGEISGLVIDTKDFKGNFPRAFSVDAANVTGGADPSGTDSGAWTEILSSQKGYAHKEHEFGSAELKNVEGKVWTHVRLVIYPDGGVKRLRVLGVRRV